MSAERGTRIEISGLREFQRSLRRMDSALPRQLRIALNDSSDLVIKEAKPEIPRRTGTAAASLKARSTQREARVAAGGKRASYYPWLDFGGRVGRNGSVVRPYLKEGRYIYPALRKNRPEIQAVLEKSIRSLAHDAGLGVD
jgi:hypothetical protein